MKERDVIKPIKTFEVKKPIYLESGRMACTPEYEREAIEFRIRYENERRK